MPADGEPSGCAPAGPLSGRFSCPQTGSVLGDYQLLEEIGRGGMGVVFRARQLSLNREVAVKVLPGGRSADPTFVKRFYREAEAAASLEHPNIVSIHEVGEEHGQLYFSMDLITGCSLAQLNSAQRLPERQAAEILRAVAEAVGFAHERHLLHRDLKPSNVLLDEERVPHITDFGLVKRADDQTEITLTGQILGSPNYMAPEQADPDLGPTTAVSDVYSLGAILYHLLTGRPPYLAETIPQTLRLLAVSEPVSPSLVQPGVSRELEVICLKCLERTPAQRYASAQELAQDLNRFLSGQPIQARPIGPGTKTLRWCKRNRALAYSLAVVAMLLLLLGIGSPIALIRIRGEHERSEAGRKTEAALRLLAQAGEKKARHQLYTALVQQAKAAVQSGEIGQRLDALEAVRRAAAFSNSVALRGEAVAALALPDLQLERALTVPPDTTLEILNPSFDKIALCRGAGDVEIRTVPELRLLTTFPASTNRPAYLGWWKADERYLAIKRDLLPGGERADVELWQMQKPEHLVTVLHNVSGRALSFDPQRNRLIAAQDGQGVGIWDLETGKETARLATVGTPTCLEFSPDGARFVAATPAGDGFKIAVADATTGALLVSCTTPEAIMQVAWHPWGRWVAVADQSGAVSLVDSHTGELRVLGSHRVQAVTVTFSPEGDYLMSGGWEGELICWDMRTLRRSLGIQRNGWTTQFRADGQKCVIFTEAQIQLYAFIRPLPRGFAGDLGPRLLNACFSPDARWLAASADNSLGVWDLTSAGPGSLVPGMSGSRMAFTADSQRIIAASEAGKCSCWRLNPSNGPLAPLCLEPVGTPMPMLSSVCAVSNILAMTGSRGSAMGNSEDLACAGLRWFQSADGVNGLSPDLHWFGIYRPFDPVLHIYRLPGVEPCAELTARSDIGGFAFAPHGDELAVSSYAGIEFWNTTSWMQTRVLTNFTGILFSPKGSDFWLTSHFRTAGLYNAATVQPVLPLPSGTLPLALSSDGRFLAVSADARYLQVWDLQTLRGRLRQLGLDWE
ncbi:MAG TPA: serine/threonine-protein kinase [Verrucomicrobiae bacterium]|nr:serine/threonine-protein kinase [Verrucomicrobiae bacterium]